MSVNRDQDDLESGVSTRRAMLRLGAIAVPAIVTMKPAYATNTSVMKCQISGRSICWRRSSVSSLA